MVRKSRSLNEKNEKVKLPTGEEVTPAEAPGRQPLDTACSLVPHGSDKSRSPPLTSKQRCNNSVRQDNISKLFWRTHNDETHWFPLDFSKLCAVWVGEELEGCTSSGN
ncbi:hypothetical protein Tcan_01895 [Toxocara canis]|uniref:Uncharacterized protein n=1 Tax=Toxocara canis TaxID=6265 RepID=A0A0B2UX84_TOXCA|nr:hypothetical protein Tcan_01895 [Toxocara canis]